MHELAKRQADLFIPKRTPFALNEIPLIACSLDLLTPWYQIKYRSELSEGEQILLHSVFEVRANFPLAAPFSSGAVSVNSRQNTRSHVHAVLKSLVKKDVLMRAGPSLYRLRNPGLELWIRVRSLNMLDYLPIVNAVCPVYLKDTDMDGSEFWNRICAEAGVRPEISIRKRSPLPP